MVAKSISRVNKEKKDKLKTKSRLPDELVEEMTERELDKWFGIDKNGYYKSRFVDQKSIYGSRKTKYCLEFAPLLVYHMGKGFSFSSFSALIGVTNTTLYRWVKEHEDFAEAREIGESRREYRWESIILESAKGKLKGNSASIMFALKNYYPDKYKDKREVEQVGTVMLVDTGIKRQPRTIEAEVVPSGGMIERTPAEDKKEEEPNGEDLL